MAFSLARLTAAAPRRFTHAVMLRHRQVQLFLAGLRFLLLHFRLNLRRARSMAGMSPPSTIILPPSKTVRGTMSPW